jgi:hypothetical protein
MKMYWESGDTAPHILNLGATWRWVVSFTIRPLYSRERAADTRWIRGWVDPRAESGRGDEEKNFQPLLGIELRSSIP